MNIRIRDEIQFRRYLRLSEPRREQVEQIIRRHLAACARMKVEPDLDVTVREAIDMVLSGNWEPDRPMERPEVRWHYDVYTTPNKEAA